jgi:hypothetical protein
MLHWNSEIADLPIHALKIGFERQHLGGRDVFLQARFDSPQPAIHGAKAVFNEPRYNFGAKLNSDSPMAMPVTSNAIAFSGKRSAAKANTPA